MADNRIQIDIEVDSKEASRSVDNVGRSAGKAGDAISSAFGGGTLGKLTSVAAKFSIITHAAVLVATAVKEIGGALVGLSERSEQIKAINSQFEALSKNAGISAGALRDSLLSASKGLVDDEDLLKAANKALIDFGQSAQSLPEIFELSRKASAAFGLDTIDVFEDINKSISSGQTRALRQIGLFIDAEDAAKKYASSLGVTAQELSRAGREQAILNEVLERGGKAFASIDETQLKVTNANKKLSVSFGNLLDNASEAYDKTFGSATRGAIDETRSLVDSVGRSFERYSKTSLEDAPKRTEELKDRISELEKSLKAYEAATATPTDWRRFLSGGNFNQELSRIKKDLADAQSELAKIGSLSDATDDIIRLRKESLRPVGGAPAAAKKEDPINRAAALAAANARSRESIALEQQLIAITNSRIEAEKAGLSAIEDRSERQVEAVRIRNEQIALINDEFNLKGDQLIQQQSENKLFTEQQLTESLINLQIEREAKIKAIQDAAAVAAGSSAVTIAQAFSSVMEGFKKESTDLAEKAEANFKRIGASMLSGLGGAAGAAFSALGKALAKGQNGLEAFASAFLASIGEMAVQLGTNFILTGIAYAFSGVAEFQAKSAPLIAAGAALATFGGLLSGLTGGAGSGSSAAVGGGTGVSSTPVADVDLSEIEAEKKSRVTVNIQGDVLDTRDTGLRIVELIQEAFDTNGAVATVGRA